MDRITLTQIQRITLTILALVSSQIVSSQTLSPIEIVVPFAAGSATDGVARAYQNQLENHAARESFVSNKPGANGLIGLDYFLALKRPSNAIAVLPSTVYVADKLRTRKDSRSASLIPIGLVGTTGFALVTSKPLAKKFTAKLSESFDQSRPPSFGFSSFGAEISARLFLKSQNLEGIGAQYRVPSGVIADLINGTIDFAFLDTLNAQIACDSEILSIIAITAEPQVCSGKSLPEVSTISTMPRVESWFVIVAHAQDNQQKTVLNLQAALNTLGMSKEMQRLGVNFHPIYAADLASYLDKQVTQWTGWLRNFSSFHIQ